MSEGSDYYESSYNSGHCFHQARSFFDQNAGRSYVEAKKTGKTHEDMCPKTIHTDAQALFAYLGDVTGSMGDSPKDCFAKAEYLQHEIRTEYMGQDTDMLYGAFGDGSPPEPDKYPLQFRHPLKVTLGSEKVRKEIIELITTEQGGGGQHKENSELALLYLLRNVSAPNAKLKICVVVTDEAPYDKANKTLARDIAFVTLKSNKPTAEIIEELIEDGWKIYVIQRPYGRRCGNTMDHDTALINEEWTRLVGDNIAYLPDINRIVDVIFGILGDATDRYDYFMEEIVERQLKDNGGQAKIDAAFKALRKIHARHQQEAGDQTQGSGSSKLHVKLEGKPGKKLLS